MRKFPILFLLLLATAAAADETVTVYQLTGAVQCLEAKGVPLEQAADLLRAQGVKVETGAQRRLPLDLGDHCGAPTGEANVLTVAAADWTSFTNQNPDGAGYGLWVFEESSLEVYMYDGTLQCGMGQETPLAEMAEKLSEAGIKVLESRKGGDGLAHIAVCGASTGDINVFRIPREDLPAAQALGFRVLVTREMIQGIKPKVERSTGVAVDSALGPASATLDSIPLLW